MTDTQPSQEASAAWQDVITDMVSRAGEYEQFPNVPCQTDPAWHRDEIGGWVARIQQARAADAQQIAALRAENERLFKELAYEVDQRRQVENLMQLEANVAAVRCSGSKHHWSESADAEGDTCDCGEWYRFADRIESSR